MSLRGKKGMQDTHPPSVMSRLSHIWGAPATEPDTEKMSPRGWLEGSGNNRTAVGSWYSLVRSPCPLTGCRDGAERQTGNCSRGCPVFCDTLQPKLSKGSSLTSRHSSILEKGLPRLRAELSQGTSLKHLSRAETAVAATCMGRALRL